MLRTVTRQLRDWANTAKGSMQLTHVRVSRQTRDREQSLLGAVSHGHVMTRLTVLTNEQAEHHSGTSDQSDLLTGPLSIQDS
jgi:hypothetical protein